MPIVVVVLLVLLLPAVLVVLVPLTLLQRYRVGTARRPARGWVVAINVFSFAVSAGLYVVSAAVTSLWVPDALRFTLAGLAAGGLLGLLGVAATRWEAGAEALHFTPNRWLVLAVMLVVASRLGYGLWRAATAWWSAGDDGSWLAEAGLPGSMAAGALVIGYALAYWAGVRGRLLRHRRPRPREAGSVRRASSPSGGRRSTRAAATLRRPRRGS